MGNRIEVYDKSYLSWTVKKGQVLADFLMKIQSFNLAECQIPKEEIEVWWVLNTDGSTNVQGTGIGVILQSTNGLMLGKGIRLGFEVTNNKVEYEALIYGLELAYYLNIKKLEVRGDSVVITGQMTRVYEVKEPRQKKSFDKASAIAKYFEQIETK